MTRRIVALLGGLLLMIPLAAAPAMAGNPHFVGRTVITVGDASLSVSGKIAGLGNEESVQVQITAEAQCVNPGGNEPKADNKDAFSVAGVFPVQNGKALFSLVLIAALQPDCSPPMTIVWTDLVVTDLTHGISRSFPGPFSA